MLTSAKIGLLNIWWISVGKMDQKRFFKNVTGKIINKNN
jgi:hypothetical protein